MHTLVVTVCGEMEDGVEEVDIAGSALDYKCTHWWCQCVGRWRMV